MFLEPLLQNSSTADCHSIGGHDVNRLRPVEKRVLSGALDTGGRKLRRMVTTRGEGLRIYNLHRISLGYSNHGA
jgi:hypothetical protein